MQISWPILKKDSKSPLLLSTFYPFLKIIEGKNTLRGGKWSFTAEVMNARNGTCSGEET